MSSSEPNPTPDKPGDNPLVPRRRLRPFGRFSRRQFDAAEREARRRRIRRHGRRAYIRSVYSLPSLATLGNAVCGFGAIYTAALDPDSGDPWIYRYRFLVAAYLIFAAMFFDAIDGRLARFTRHTTDFGGQLDSLADVVSFGCAPAFLALQLFRDAHFHLDSIVGRLVWAIGALYVSCAALRLARFNVSNEHGEQHHFSFLGLPSPGAGAAVAAFVLMQQDLFLIHSAEWPMAGHLSTICVAVLPLLVLTTGLLMVSAIRYPHLVNRYLRGRHPIGRVVVILVTVLLIITAHRYLMGLGAMGYVFYGLVASSWRRLRLNWARPTEGGG